MLPNPRILIVILLVLGIGLAVYLSGKPQLFYKFASEGSIIDLKFIPELVHTTPLMAYEVKIAINPKVERVTSASLEISYNPQAISIIGVENNGFLPIVLKSEDDHAGHLKIVYGSTIENVADKPGFLATIRFKSLTPIDSQIAIKPGSEITVSSVEGNVLNTYPVLQIQPAEGGNFSEQDQTYPNNLLLEKAFFASSEPVVRDYRNSLDPQPELKPERVGPEFSVIYVKQLGNDIFVAPIQALNQVLEEKTGKIISKD